MDEFIVQLMAELNTTQVLKDINDLKRQLEGQNINLKVALDTNSNKSELQEFAKQLQSAISQASNGKLNIDTSQILSSLEQVTKSAQQTGKSITKGVEDAIKGVSSKSINLPFKVDSDASKKVTKEIEELVSKWTDAKGRITDIKIDTKTSIDEETGERVEKITRALVTYKTELDEVIKKTLTWEQIGFDNKTNEPIEGFVEAAGQYSKAIDQATTKTDNFAKKQKETIANMQNTIKQITSRAFDLNSSRPITSDDSLEKLNRQTAYVENAMYDLRHATAETFDEAKLKVQNEISELKILEKELRNVDNLSSKQKDFSTIKIDEGNKLDAFVQKMEQSGHYTDELKSKVTALRTDLSNIFDENSLTNYLKGLNSLENEFKKVDATAKTSEKATKEADQLVEKLEKSYQTIKNLEVKKETLDVSKDINKIVELDEQIKIAKKDFDTLFTQISVNSNFDASKWVEAKSTIDTDTQNQIKYNNAKQQDILNSSINTTVDNLNKLKSEWQKQGVLVGDFKTKVEELEKELSSVGNQNELNGLKSQIETLKTEVTHIEEIKNIKSLSSGGIKNDYSTQLAKLEGQFRSLGLTEDEVKTKTSNVSNALNALKAKVNQPFDESNYQEIISLNDKLQKELAESSNEYTRLQSSAKGYVSVHQRLTKANTIEAWNQKNSNATKEAIANNESYIASLRDLNSQMTKMEFEQISRGFKETENSMRGINRLGASLANQFKEAAKGITQIISISSGVMALANKVQEIPKEVIKVDSAMIELSKVSNASASDIKNYFDEAAESAKNYGSSVSDMINATADWSRLGYNLPDAKQLAEVATLYTNVGDGIDMSAANESLISTLQGFQLEAEDAMGIIDKFNEVDMLAS